MMLLAIAGLDRMAENCCGPRMSQLSQLTGEAIVTREVLIKLMWCNCEGLGDHNVQWQRDWQSASCDKRTKADAFRQALISRELNCLAHSFALIYSQTILYLQILQEIILMYIDAVTCCTFDWNSWSIPVVF